MTKRRLKVDIIEYMGEAFETLTNRIYKVLIISIT